MFKHVVSNTILRDWLRSSVVGPIAESYVTYLIQHGYASCTIENYLQCVAHFAFWLTKKHIELHCIDDVILQHFLTTHLPACHCPRPSPRTPANLRRALRHLLLVLRSEGYVPPRSTFIPEAVREELEHFDVYLRDVCGLAPATCLYRLRYVREFLLAQFGCGPIELSRLKPGDICRAVTARAAACKPRTVGIKGDSLRSYLRFKCLQAQINGTCPRASRT